MWKRNLSKKELKRMNIKWSKLISKINLEKKHWFSSFLWQTNILISLGPWSRMALHRLIHHLIQLVFLKCHKHWATKNFIDFNINIMYKYLELFIMLGNSQKFFKWRVRARNSNQKAWHYSMMWQHVCLIKKPIFHQLKILWGQRGCKPN